MKHNRPDLINFEHSKLIPWYLFTLRQRNSRGAEQWNHQRTEKTSRRRPKTRQAHSRLENNLRAISAGKLSNKKMAVNKMVTSVVVFVLFVSNLSGVKTFIFYIWCKNLEQYSSKYPNTP